MADLNIGTLATVTGRLRAKKLKDSVSDHRPFTAAMKEMGGIRRVDGGRTIVKEFSYQQNPTVGWIGEGEEISLGQIPVVDAAEFGWFHAGGSFTITGPEKRKNSGGGNTKYIDIVTAKMKVLEASMMNIYHSGVLSAGTGNGGKQLTGLLNLVSKTPASGTVGGIDTSGADAAFYRNYDFDTATDWSDGSVDAGNVERALDKLINNTTWNMGKRFGYMGDTHFEALSSALRGYQRIAKADDNVGSKHEYLMYRGIKWFFGGGVNFSGESQIADDQSYLICPGEEGVEIVFHKDAEFELLEPVDARNQDAVTRLMILMIAMCVANRKVQATIYDS